MDLSGEMQRLRERADTAEREAERVRGLREWCSCCGEPRESHDEDGCEEFEPSGCFEGSFGDIVFPWE